MSKSKTGPVSSDSRSNFKGNTLLGEERYRQLVENLNDAIYSVQIDGTIAYVSPVITDILGYTPEEIVGRNLLHLVHPEDRGNIHEVFEDVHQWKTSLGEYRILNKSGDVRWVRISCRPLLAGGIVTGLQGVLTDTTDRKLAVEAIERRVEELDALQETVLDITKPHKLSDLLYTIIERAAHLLKAEGGGLYLCDEEKQEVRCVVSYRTPNDYTSVTLKYGEGLAGLIGQSGESLLIEDYSKWSGRAKVFEKDHPFQSTIGVPMIWQGKVIGVIDILKYTGSNPFTKNDLELLKLFANHAAIACENARALDAEQAAFARAEREIDERKRAEEESRESEQRFRTIVETFPGIIWMTKNDPSYTPIYLSDSVEEIYGYPKESFLSGRYRFVDLVFPEDLDRMKQAVAASLNKKKPYSVELRFRRIDGRMIWIQEIGQGVFDENGALEYLIGTVMDITERKKAEESLRESEVKTKRLLDQQIAVNQLALTLGETLDRDTVYATIYKYVQELADAWVFLVASYDDHQKTIRVEYSINDGQVFDVNRLPDIPIRESKKDILSRVIHHGDPVNSPDLLNDIDLSQKHYRIERNGSIGEITSMEDLLKSEPRSALFVPMKVKGKVTGVMELQSTHLNAYTQEDVELMTALANVAAVAIENARLYEEVRKELDERKRVEEELQEQRDFFYQVMNTMGQGIAVTDENERFEYVNPTYAKMTGYPFEELIGKFPKDFTPPDEHALLFRETALRQAGESSSYEIRLINRQGQQMFILVTAVPRLIEGAYKGAIAVITDLTERKLAEEALRRERDRAQLYLDTASVMLIAHDSQGQVMMINRRTCAVLGCEEHDVLGKKWVDNFVPKRMREKVSHVFDILLEGNLVDGEFNENPIITSSREERLVSWHNTVIQDENGHIIGHLGSGEDITERKRAEEALEKSEAKYRSLAENAGVGIATIDSDGKLIHTNTKLCEMIGYPEEALLGKSFVDFIHQDDLAGIFKAFQQAGLNPETETQIEYRIIRKDGKAIICFSTPRFFWEKGRIGGFSAIIQDITERKKAEEKASREAANVAALARVAARLNAQIDLETVLNTICEETATALGFPAASIDLYDEKADNVFLAANYGLPSTFVQQYHPASRKFVDGFTRNIGDPFIIQDIQAIPDFPDAEIYAAYDFRTLIATHLIHGNQLVGTLNVNTFGQKREISENEKAMLHSLGDLSVQAIINARLYEDVRRQAIELARSNALASGLAKVSAELQTTLDPEQVISEMGKELKILGIASFLTTLDSEEKALIMQAATIGERTLARIEKLLKIKVRGLRFRRELLPDQFDNLVSYKRPLFSQNIMEEACGLMPYIPRPLIEKALSLFEGIGSRGIYLPLISGDRVFGVLGLHSPDLIESDVAAFSVFANNISSALENARLYQAVQSELEERKRTEAALQGAEARYRALVEQVPAIAYTDSAEEMGKTLYINPQLKKIAGYDPEVWIADINLWMKIIHPEDRDRVFTEFVRTFQTGEPFNVDYRIISPEGLNIWFHDEATLIRDRTGQPLFWQGIMLNVTNQKQAEDALRKALAEKEVLLREVHHRVKNNLQAIIYLIEGRIDQISDQHTISLLKGLEEQARTMALVYEQLYQSENLAEVRMKHYLLMLSENIREAFSGKQRIEVRVESEDITLDIGTAMPCGLMVTELLSNSLKHAFPPGFERSPRIEIKLSTREGHYDLVVKNNGVSLPPDLDERAKGSMGLRLVRLWATHQLGGTFEIESDEEVTFHVTFPMRSV